MKRRPEKQDLRLSWAVQALTAGRNGVGWMNLRDIFFILSWQARIQIGRKMKSLNRRTK
jgi:hypothetical protein